MSRQQTDKENEYLKNSDKLLLLIVSTHTHTHERERERGERERERDAYSTPQNVYGQQIEGDTRQNVITTKTIN